MPPRRLASGFRRLWSIEMPGEALARSTSKIAVGLVVVLTVAVPFPAAGQGQDRSIFHVPPVSAPVSEEFRAPEHPFGPGNRGLEYDTEPGTEIRASADGEVAFAGRVAWDLHVTVQHADGVRTSYSFLSEIQIVVGQTVQQGDLIGLAGEKRFHFGARRDDKYFDPASLFGAVDVHVELLPLEVPPGTAPDDERAALWLLSSGEGVSRSFSQRSIELPGIDDVRGWLADGDQLVRHYLTELDPVGQALDLGWELQRRLLFPPPCTDDGAPVVLPSVERLAVTVGGLGSSSESASIDRLDVDALGYSPDEVVRYSYAGGHVPGTGGEGFAGLEATTYTSGDTQGDLRGAAKRLADLVETAASERPGRTIDLYAHSMGGVVTRLALLELERRGFPLRRLGVVATIGSPHGGADLGTVTQAAGTMAPGEQGLEMMEQVLGTGLDPGSVAVAQLSEESDLVTEMREAGVPEGVDLVSIAARGDLVVPAPRTQVDGARNVTVPESGKDAHGDLVASDVTTHELSLALAGMPQRCIGVWDLLNDEVSGRGISYVQDVLGLGLLAAP